MSARKAKAADLTMDPPVFTLEENPDLEIFTFRMPSRISLNSLDKLEFDLSGTKPCTFQAGGEKYKLQLGTAVENESFRVLVPKAKAKKADDKDSDDSDDDDDEDEKFLQSASIPFSRHFNVLASTKEMTERIVAPRQDKAPANVDPMFRAYAHVPQKTGLKRRWMPLGVSVAEASAEPKQVKAATTKTKTTPMKKESSPSKKQKGDKGKKASTPSKETNGTSSEAKAKRIKLEEETTDAGATPSKKSDKKDKDKSAKKEAKKDKKESKKKRKSSVKKEEE